MLQEGLDSPSPDTAQALASRAITQERDRPSGLNNLIATDGTTPSTSHSLQKERNSREMLDDILVLAVVLCTHCFGENNFKCFLRSTVLDSHL